MTGKGVRLIVLLGVSSLFFMAPSLSEIVVSILGLLSEPSVSKPGLQLLGGLNVDPYESSEAIGRVRRLYVLPAFRRSSVASSLMEKIESLAVRHFELLQLYTASEVASLFYIRLGYTAVNNRTKVSHEKRFDA